MDSRYRVGIVAVVLALMLMLSGCTSPEADEGPADTDDGEDETPSGPAPPEDVQLDVATDGTYPVDPGFDPDELTVVAGANVTVTLTNEDLLVPHAWQLEGVSGAQTDTAESGESASVTFTAPEPGEYEFFCPVGNHRDLGQVGTFVVTAANATASD